MITLREHLLDQDVDQEVRRIIYHLASSARYIALLMGEANRKLASTTNLTGDTQLELDIHADKIIMDRLRQNKGFCIHQFASEEQDSIVQINQCEGEYSIAADPLDGSSNVDSNLAVGSIFGVHKGGLLNGKSGRESMVAALYVQYGPLTTLVYSAGSGTHEFVLNPAGEYVLSTPNMQLKEKGNIYSPGGKKQQWSPNHRKFVDDLEHEGYKLRYSGAFVADVNQILIKKGGIFMYPALQDAPKGKLRLLVELQIMAFLIEQAGGAATNGKTRILDLIPETLDERSPIYCGSKHEVEQASNRELL